MGVNVGLLPTKGLTLPLISYGGSSLTIGCIAMGLLLRVSFELDKATRQRQILRNDTVQSEAPASPAVRAERVQLRDVLPPMSHVADRVANLLRRTEKQNGTASAPGRVEPVMPTEEGR